jgi:hypothetical protein
MPNLGVWTLHYDTVEKRYLDPLIWIDIDRRRYDLSYKRPSPFGDFIVLFVDEWGNPSKNVETKKVFTIDDEKIILELQNTWPQPNDQRAPDCPLAANPPACCPDKSVCPLWCYDVNYRVDCISAINIFNQRLDTPGAQQITVEDWKNQTDVKQEPIVIEENTKDVASGGTDEGV